MLVQIDYELQFAAPFHLGTGIAAGLIDRTVIRDAGGDLYVPASTFKGVLREHCEQLCRFYLPNVQVASPHNAYAALAQFGKAPTLISRIFGSPLYPGGLRFNDARQQDETHNMYGEIQTSVATQVRIDRMTRTAANEALYTSEFGTRYLVFEGTIKGRLDCTPIKDLAVTVQGQETYTLTPTYSLLILLAGLLMVERLGGNKSTGKGQCRCFTTNVQLDRRKCTSEQWQSWIEQLEVLKDYDERGGQA
ncbi:MAG: RAMP superfamily CRISPR-associated protein [Ktedonobacteraceae bacterium]